MKSAYELAMERLRQEQGDPTPLSDDQKNRLAAITQEYKAKIVEKEMAMRPQIEAALIQGEVPEAEKVRDALAAEITRLREQEEAAREAIRQEGGDDSAPDDPPRND